MNVMEAARRIGLDPTSGDITGTIDEARVLAALSELAEHDRDHEDVIADAAARVREARSAGFEELPPTSLGAGREGEVVQLRYRAEVADIFTDLAIDIGLRRSAGLVDAPL